MDRMLKGSPGLGPTKSFGSGDVAKGVAFVMAAYAKNPNEPVVLYGHSWGGAAALIAAEQLNQKGIPVSLLITFDAVGKYSDLGRGVLLVPPNVKIAINYYQTDPTELGNNRLEATSEFTQVFNIDVGAVKHTDVDDTMGPPAVGLIQSLALQMLLDRMNAMAGLGWMYQNAYGTELQVIHIKP